MDHVNGPRIEALLNGLSLPASRDEVLDYARAQAPEPDDLAALRMLPDTTYASIDELVETLAPVQPARKRNELPTPQPESGPPPGGAAYTR